MRTWLSGHHLDTHGWRKLLLPTAVVLILALTLAASPGAWASKGRCRVQNTDSGHTFPRLQQAVDAVKPGARLVVKGTCHGGTYIDKDLVIVGERTKRTPKPVLDGDAKARVLTIKPSVKVNVRSLTVRDGRATNGSGDGIANWGRATLRDVVFRLNGPYTSRKESGAPGTYGFSTIHSEGTLRLLGQSRVTNNHGGVDDPGRLVLAGDTRIRGNVGRVLNGGVLVMNDSCSIRTNDDWGHSGGGVVNHGTLTMSGTSSLDGYAIDGGVRNHGSLVMNDGSSIHDNWSGTTYLGPGGAGGGAGVMNRGTLTMNDTSSIHDKVSIASGGHPGAGARVFNMRGATLTMTGSSTITGNRAWEGGPGAPGLGGGLYNASGGTLVGVACAPHTYANVFGNTPDDCYVESP